MVMTAYALTYGIKKFDELVWDRTIFTGYGDRIVCYMEFWMLLVRFRLS